jgi:hypothetical protein
MKLTITCCLFGILWFGCSHSSVGPNSDPLPNTAKYKLADVNSLAVSYGKGLRLMSIHGDNINSNGTSSRWTFQYSDTSMPPTSYLFHSISGAVGFDSTRPTGVGSGFIETKSWFNSDSALAIAEKSGGSEFRAQNPHYTITASIGIPVVPNPRTMWYVTYQSSDVYSSFLMLSIDANSGAIIARNE